jgi:PPR repeat
VLPLFRLITFATPHWGAYSSVAANVLPTKAAQVKDLGYDSAYVHEVNQLWAQSDADEKVMVQYVVAADDAIVDQFSAQGAHYDLDFVVVPSHGHGSIVKPETDEHPGYQVARNFLLRTSQQHPGIANADKTPPNLLLNPAEQKEGVGRFVYTARYIPLAGRERELAQLNGFLNGYRESNFAWMLMQGEGGVGKSRLAFELCLAWQSDWHTGFLFSGSIPPDWSRWQPRLPTLIVVDYATNDTEALTKLLLGLANRNADQKLRRPVRVLLLERPNQEDRLKLAFAAGSQGIALNLARSADLALTTIDEPWAIIHSFCTIANRPLPDKANALKKFSEIDPQRRPLLAMMLADALTQDMLLEIISRDTLFDWIIDRERKNFWLPAAKRDESKLKKAERLVALATMMGGLTRAALTDALEKDRPLPAWDSDEFAEVFRAISGYDTQHDEIEPLEPDLIGEYFVCKVTALLSDDTTASLVNFAFNTALDTFAFFDRLAQDYLNEPLLSTAGCAASHLKSPIARAVWSRWVVNLIGRTGKAHPRRAQTAFNELRSLREQFPQDERVRLHFAKAAVNLISALGNAKDVEAAQAVFTEMRALRGQLPQDEGVRLQVAKAAFNLINALGNAKDAEAAQAVFSALRSLLEQFPQDEGVRLVSAKAAVNLINALSNAKDVEAAQAVFGELEQLAASFPTDLETQGVWAVAQKHFGDLFHTL